jgi:16S rRNA (guanine966-N2)-methyltransferase
VKETVRIIAGLYRGKKLHFPAVEGLRPTPDRVKETLFNWLMPVIQGARCLDAFAGSGSLGFEAFSRGAQRVVLIEASIPVYKNLKKNAVSLSAENIAILNTKAEAYLQTTSESFDIIFLDPPFAEEHIPLCLSHLAQTKTLVKGGLLYLESPSKPELNPLLWKERRSKQAGRVFYTLYEKMT